MWRFLIHVEKFDNLPTPTNCSYDTFKKLFMPNRQSTKHREVFFIFQKYPKTKMFSCLPFKATMYCNKIVENFPRFAVKFLVVACSFAIHFSKTSSKSMMNSFVCRSKRLGLFGYVNTLDPTILYDVLPFISITDTLSSFPIPERLQIKTR